MSDPHETGRAGCAILIMIGLWWGMTMRFSEYGVEVWAERQDAFGETTYLHFHAPLPERRAKWPTASL